MKLYAEEPRFLHNRFREASPAEILSAARPHADLEAAQAVVFYIGGEPVNVTPPVAKAIVLAALGADDE